jgi:hypothetical protein
MGSENFRGYENNNVFCTRKWMMIFCLETMNLCATTSAVLLVISGVEKIPGPGVEAEKSCKFCVAGAIEISNRKFSVTHVDAVGQVAQSV